jgi:hypothetical protein
MNFFLRLSLDVELDPIPMQHGFGNDSQCQNNYLDVQKIQEYLKTNSCLDVHTIEFGIGYLLLPGLC